MDALSAMNMVMGPGTATKINNGIEDTKPKKIDLGDLQKLNLGSPSESVSSTDGPGGSGSFEKVLGSFVNDVNSQQAAANDALTGLMSGKNVSLHQAMISMQEANVSFQMMVEVRNKLLESYQELMRMQV